MKKLALLFVVLMGTSIAVTAAPCLTKNVTSTELFGSKKHKHHNKHNSTATAKPETAKSAAAKPEMKK